MLDDFLTRALLAGIGIALIAGPLGCFIIWRRSAYFGDATAHTALLGVAIALAFDLPVLGGVLMITATMGVGTALLASGRYAMDTLLGVAAHAALATGLVALALLDNVRIDLMGYLFGDILAISKTDLAIIFGGGLVIALALQRLWKPLLNATLSEELSWAEGGNPARDRLLLNLLLAFLIAVAMKIVGVLLITAMLIIPAASARPLSRTPELMAVFAALIGVLAVIAGLQASLHFDTPAGPSIVVTATLFFAATNLVHALSLPFRSK